jgi:hypothetical protein
VSSRGLEVSVAGGGQPQADGDVRERAETYLRLLAETELRRALGSPAIRRPDLGTASLPLRAAYQVLPPAAALAARAVRPLDPLVCRVLATRERVQGRALPAASPAARWTFGAVSGLAATGSTSAGAVERAGWQIRRIVRGRQAAGRFDGPGPVRAGLDRVGRLASDFAAAELIDPAAADSLVDGLESALAARSRLEPRGPGWAMRRRIGQRRGSPRAGQVVAIPLGRPVSIPSGDGQIQVTLLALILAADRAEVTLTGRLPAVADGGARQRLHRWSELLSGSATDDRGATYQAHVTAGWDESRIDGALSFRPVPPARVRWLDVKVGESDPVRVQLAGSQPVTAEWVEGHAGPVERFIDSWAERLLGHHWLHGAGDVAVAPEAIAALREVGAVGPDSPALGRLAAQLRRLGCDSPVIRDVPSADLPESWASRRQPAGRGLPRDRRNPLRADRAALGAGFGVAAARRLGRPGTRLAGVARRDDVAVGVGARRHRALAHRRRQRRRLRRRPRRRDAPADPADPSQGSIAGDHAARQVRPGDRDGPAGLAGGAMTAPWWAAFGPAEATWRCGDQQHRLRWEAGQLTAVDHPEAEGELVLGTLGGDQADCIRLLRAWGEHRDDLDVLMLGPRSATDTLTAESCDAERLRMGLRGWAGYAPLPGLAPGGVIPGMPLTWGSLLFRTLRSFAVNARGLPRGIATCGPGPAAVGARVARFHTAHGGAFLSHGPGPRLVAGHGPGRGPRTRPARRATRAARARPRLPVPALRHGRRRMVRTRSADGTPRADRSPGRPPRPGGRRLAARQPGRGPGVAGGGPGWACSGRRSVAGGHQVGRRRMGSWPGCD